MCRKRLSNLEQVQADMGARLAGQAEEMRLVRESIVEMRNDVAGSMMELRHEVRISLDVLRVELQEAHREVKALADSNIRIETLLERVLQAVGPRPVVAAVKE
jgi:uncharacterized protein involved in exopolysaccharide biosynthesis